MPENKSKKQTDLWKRHDASTRLKLANSVVKGSCRSSWLLARSLFLHVWTKLKEVGGGCFKMVVGLLSPQLSRFFHTVTVFDSPALSNNCHKSLIIHYRFFFCINISAVTDVNSRLGSLCHRLTASPKLISSLFFFFYSSVYQLTAFPYSFFCCSLWFAFAWIHYNKKHWVLSCYTA